MASVLSFVIFRLILEVDPGHVQARHNLCVVMVEKGDLGGAEKCLVAVKESAPDLDYVARHLDIVRNRIRILAEKKEEEKGKTGNVDGAH